MTVAHDVHDSKCSWCFCCMACLAPNRFCRSASMENCPASSKDTWQMAMHLMRTPNTVSAARLRQAWRIWERTTSSIVTWSVGENRGIHDCRQGPICAMQGVEPLFLLTSNLSLRGYLKSVRTLIHVKCPLCYSSFGRSFVDMNQWRGFGFFFWQAARNVLLGSGLVCKVADFGLSRRVQTEDNTGDYYRRYCADVASCRFGDCLCVDVCLEWHQ